MSGFVPTEYLERQKMTPYQRHRQQWRKCIKCYLSADRNQVVLARGRVPAKILFIGEAPGASEDVIGRPFVGPAGKLLDHIILGIPWLSQGIDGQYDYAITNLVACIPKGKDGAKLSEPTKECIEACKDRLQQFVILCKPRMLVCVGALAAKWVPLLLNTRNKEEYDMISITHPAAILRMNIAQRGLAVQRAVVTIADAVSDF